MLLSRHKDIMLDMSRDHTPFRPEEPWLIGLDIKLQLPAFQDIVTRSPVARTCMEALVYMGHAPEVVHRYVEMKLAFRRSKRWGATSYRIRESHWRRWMIGPEHDLKVQPMCSMVIENVEEVSKSRPANSDSNRKLDQNKTASIGVRKQNPLLLLQKS